MTDPELHYFCKPAEIRPVSVPVEFLSLAEFLTDEPSCKVLWDLLHSQFHTRSKFLAIWSGVRHVALHRDSDGVGDGFLLVNAPVNWQIDYVVVHPDARGQGIGKALVVAALNQAYLHRVPYVMLTSKASLRPLYESCGFEAIQSPSVV